GENPAQAAVYYKQYLERKPGDAAALRQLAKAEMAAPDFAAARRTLQAMLAAGPATVADYEQLIHAYRRAKQLSGAQPVAKKLAAIDRDNALARETIQAYADQQKGELVERARTLAAAKRFGEAIQVYREYNQQFGADKASELALARLYSWSEQ